MLGIIGGTSLLFSRLPEGERRVIYTPFGNSEVLCGDCALLLRHQHNRPPHRINFRSHLAALAICGVTRLVVIGSAGSLKRGIVPGSVIIPSDYMSMTSIPSIHEHAIRHVHPGFSPEFSKSSLHSSLKHGMGGCMSRLPGRGSRLRPRSACLPPVPI